MRDDPHTKADLQKLGQKPVTEEEAKKLAANMKICGYLECSALTQKGLKNVFDEAIKCVIFPNKTKKKKKDCLLV